LQAKSHLPLALVVDDEPLHREFAAGVLASSDWRVMVAASGEEALDMVTHCPALVLMDLQLTGMSGREAVSRIRQIDGRAASVPVLAFTTLRTSDLGDLRAAGFDGLVAKPCTPADLLMTAAAWRPDDDDDAMRDRLGATFGVAEMERLTSGFRDLLVTALNALDGDDARPLAHRVAGLAGTLGYRATGQAWLAVSHGDASAVAAVRRETRRAIASIDRRAYAAAASTSV